MITSTANPTIRSVRRLHTAKGRREAGRTIVEGPNGREALIRFGVVPELLLVTADDDASLAYATSIGLDPVVVSDRVLAAASDTRSPVGPVTVIAIPDGRGLRTHPTAILMDVADPGNVGTAIRSAAAMDWDVAVAGSSADPWSPKAVRSAAGATLGVRLSTLESALDAAADAQLVTVALVVRDGRSPDDVRAALDGSPCAIIIGGEAHGLPESIVGATDHRLTLPMTGRVESLNAATAAAIAMYGLHHPTVPPTVPPS